jgi:hypothetical protein
MKKPHRYRDLKVTEISFVDKGASPGARICFWKRAASATEKQMTLEEILAKLPEEEKAVILAAIESATAKAAEPEKEEEEKSAEPEKEEAEKSEDEKEEEEKAKTAKALAALPASVRKQLAEADALKSRVAKMEAENETRTFVEKARTMPVVGLATADLAEVLKAAELGRPLTKEIGTKLTKALRAISVVVAKGEAFGELGTSAPGEQGSGGKLASIAKSIRAAEPKLTQAQAYAKALRDNPDLYNEYERENPPIRG